MTLRSNPPPVPVSSSKRSTIDKILEVLDQPQQHSPERGYPEGSLLDTVCWRCECPLPEPTQLGACARCVADLKGERPVQTSPRPKLLVDGRVVGEVESFNGHRATFTIEDEAFEGDIFTDTAQWMREFSTGLEAVGEAAARIDFGLRPRVPTPPGANARFIDGSGRETRPSCFVNVRPGTDRVLFPVVTEGNAICAHEGSALPHFDVETYRLVSPVPDGCGIYTYVLI